jgi:hypothetical protein
VVQPVFSGGSVRRGGSTFAKGIVIMINTTIAATDHDKFLKMMPVFHFQASRAFSDLCPDQHQDCLAEVVGHAWQAYVRLSQKGASGHANAWSLARFAIRAVRSGRRTGNSQNSCDLTSKIYDRRNKADTTRPAITSGNTWLESVMTDHRARPDELAITRMDFAAWLCQLSPLKRQIAEFLSIGESTRNAADHFGLTPGRISQIRKELEASWSQFQHGILAEAG